MFQSAPAIAGGRCVISCSTLPTSAGFNPRPPLLAGDALRHWLSGRPRRVSIRARHCWRAMLGFFHPDNVHTFVSIRARHCWRAMRAPRRPRATVSWFQSAPAIAGGRCEDAVLHTACATIQFQSAPAIAGGRCLLPHHRRPADCSFNPRPPLLAGDAGPLPAHHRHPRRFNPRPPLLAGDAYVKGWALWPDLFQSAPAIAGGRCLGGVLRYERVMAFQSAPAIAGGRCSA